MKASELMIGDWVKTDDGTSKVVSLHDGWHIDVEDNDYTYDEYQVYPIPLTEEILKANGFELDEDGWRYRYYIEEDDDFFILYLTDGRIDISIAESEMVLRYVHLLQHALRLCGLSELADNFKIE